MVVLLDNSSEIREEKSGYRNTSWLHNNSNRAMAGDWRFAQEQSNISVRDLFCFFNFGLLGPAFAPPSNYFKRSSLSPNYRVKYQHWAPVPSLVPKWSSWWISWGIMPAFMDDLHSIQLKNIESGNNTIYRLIVEDRQRWRGAVTRKGQRIIRSLFYYNRGRR